MKQASLFIIVLFILNFSSFAQNQKPALLNDSVRKAVLNNLASTLNSSYVFPEKAKLIAGYLDEQNKKETYNSLSYPNDFARRIVGDIRFIQNDKHLRIEYNPQLENNILKFLSSKENAASISAEDVARDERKNFYFKKLEILPSNIGYIEFNGFSPPSPSALKTIQAAMQFVSHTDALIIDLRNNFGGNVNTQISSYFFADKTYTGKTFNRIENKWRDDYIENKKAITNGLVLNMPVYILTSSRTFSAAEGLAYTLQNLKRAVVIGDTTRGGAHLTRSFSLGNGFVGFIPYMRSENVITKTDWEGTGVIPDISAEESKCIEVAVNGILQKKLNTIKDPTEKRKINWQLNYNLSKTSSLIINADDAQKFTGLFAEFEVILKEGVLMFRDIHQPGNNYGKLISITWQLFQVGTDYQVEFILDKGGKCNAIKMYWDDGWEETIQRTK
jgi:hypothetical protein